MHTYIPMQLTLHIYCYVSCLISSVSTTVCTSHSLSNLVFTTTCMHTYILSHMHTYIHTFTHAYIHTFTHTYIDTFTHAYIQAFIHTFTLTYTLGSNPDECHIFYLFRCTLSFSATLAKRWKVQFRLGLAMNSTTLILITAYLYQKILY